MPAGGCRGAAIECVIPLHPRATGVTDLRDHAVRLMKRRRRHCLGGGWDGQSKRNSDEPNHCFLQFVPSREKTPSRCGRLDASARLAHAREGELQREQPASSARRGDYRRGMGCSHKLARSPSKNWSKLLTRITHKGHYQKGRPCMAQRSPLQRGRALIVEDEILLALNLEAHLRPSRKWTTSLAACNE